MLYGAFIGDMVGVPYEFLPCESKDFKLFDYSTRFSDDSVMTMAIAEAMLETVGFTEEQTLPIIVEKLRKYGELYPGAGYGSMFCGWLFSSNPKPYSSYGNGSAMRVSSVAWIYDTLEEVEQHAEWTSKVTHDHPEGIKGAQAVAAAIFLARTGKSKKEIKDYIMNTYGYDLNRTCKQIIDNGYKFEVTCQKSVPEAIIAFLDGKDFEDVIRNAILLNGDADTQACIAGSIAEAFYGIPTEMILECRKRLPEDFLNIIQRMEEFCQHLVKPEPPKEKKPTFFENLKEKLRDLFT